MSGTKHRGRRAGLLGPMVVMALVVGPAGVLVARAAPPVDSPGPPSADGVLPVIADTRSSDDDCVELGFDHGIPIATNGRVSSGDLTVTVTGYDVPTGFADWSSTLPIHGVYVKAGPSGGNLFGYPGGDTGDRGLHTPQKPDGGYYEVSHLAFCWNDEPASPDVSIVKANDPNGPVPKGDAIVYTLTVTNDGDATATGVQVTDQLPAGVTFAEATPGCTEAGGLVTCAVGDVGPGAGLALEITVTVDDGSCGPIVNAAQVSASNESEDAATDNGSNGVTNEVACDEPAPPDLQVTKTSDVQGVLDAGDDFLYTITVTNAGDEAASGVELLDVLPAGAVSVAIPPFPTFGGDDCTITSSVPPGGVPHATLQCGPIDLAPGASASVTVKVVVTGETCGTITNVVDVDGANEPAANVGADNHAETTDEIACVPRIRLLKGGPTLAHVGDDVTYVFTVTNTGGIDLTGIDLTDPMCDTSPALTDDGDGDAELAVGEGWTFRCDHTIVEGDGDPVHNEGTVSGDHEGGTVSDSDTHDVDVIRPDIELDKTASPTSGPAGTLIVYTYAVTNTGDTTLFDIAVNDDRVGLVGHLSSLAAGQTVPLFHQVTLGSSPIVNIATVEGADVLGRTVSDEDDATVTVVAGDGGPDDDGIDGSPFTGAAVGLFAGWIAALAGVGAALLVASRRRPETSR